MDKMKCISCEGSGERIFRDAIDGRERYWGINSTSKSVCEIYHKCVYCRKVIHFGITISPHKFFLVAIYKNNIDNKKYHCRKEEDVSEKIKNKLEHLGFYKEIKKNINILRSYRVIGERYILEDDEEINEIENTKIIEMLRKKERLDRIESEIEEDEEDEEDEEERLDKMSLGNVERLDKMSLGNVERLDKMDNEILVSEILDKMDKWIKWKNGV